MSMKRSPLHRIPRDAAPRPEECARILGEHIHSARLRDGRPLEVIAPRAALTVDEWLAIEAGRAPDTWEHICLIAAALYLGRSWMPYLSRLWIGAKRNELFS